MLRVGIDGRVLGSSTGTYIRGLLEYLEELAPDIKFIIFLRPSDLDLWRPRLSQNLVVPVDVDAYTLNEQSRFLRILNLYRCDLIHFCMPQQPVLYRGVHVTTIHDLTLLQTYNRDKTWLKYHFKQLIGKYVFYQVVKSSASILVPTQFVKHAVMCRYKFVRDSKIVVTPEAGSTDADRTVIQPKSVESVASPFLLYVGQQSTYKNIERLVDAHQLLRTRFPNLRLVLVGRENGATALTKKYCRAKRAVGVEFTGYLSDPERDWLYEHCAAYVFPSLSEGFGLPGLEAMEHNAPVVSSSATCLPEVYGSAVVYFDPLDVHSMVTSIERVLTDPLLRQRLITEGRSRVRQYSWRTMAENTVGVYRRVLG